MQAYAVALTVSLTRFKKNLTLRRSAKRSLIVHTLETKRREYIPETPPIFEKLSEVCFQRVSSSQKTASSLRQLFPKTWEQKGYELVKGKGKELPLRIGVFFSGGPASGGHNVLVGLHNAMQKFSSSSQVIGFLGGPSGLLDKKWKYIKVNDVAAVKNTGGFDLLGSGRTKIESPEQMASAMQACKELTLDGLVVIGGDDSNTNAALLAEYFLVNECATRVIGVPKTIDGDLRSEEIEMSFGFDSACKTYSELIGNIAKDALSSKKYYHFIKLMGRSASNITLECALAVQPNLALIGEEERSLEEIVGEIVDLIVQRKDDGKEYGVILIPEGLIEFIPEMKALIQELNQLLSEGKAHADLKPKNQQLFSTLPEKIQEQLVSDRDPHGNITVSQIDTESLLIELVKAKLEEKFTPIAHFFGYEGRCCYPSNFDATYCYLLGMVAALAIRDGATGMICSIQNLLKPSLEWTCSLVPIVHLMHMEERKGAQKPVIQKALVDLKGKAFLEFAEKREDWKIDDEYVFPGPIQYFGDSELTDSRPKIL